MKNLVFLAVFGLTAAIAGGLCAADRRGHLVIIGGGLRRDNAAVYERLVRYAGGVKEGRFVVLPTASSSDRSAMNFRESLAHHGIPAERCEILDVTVANAERSTVDPLNLERVRRSTGLFMTGGDQSRIMQALVNAGGGDTPLLVEIRRLYERGGVIAGTSAGAAVQSETMIGASGWPDGSLDEGLDALDFGLTDNPARPGLHVARGLGLFRGGLIDQHFHQYRGRLGRLARVTTERRIAYGIGIDENTAAVVDPDAVMEVVGPGHVTLVDARRAICTDGPLGCRIQHVGVSLLANGDRWRAATGAIEPHSAKREVAAGQEGHVGGFLIPDIGAEGAVPFALISGLADNHQRRQQGIVLKHHDEAAHGYRFTFRKGPATRALAGYVDGAFSRAVIGMTLEIEPIDGRLRPPEKNLPSDLSKLPPGRARTALETLWFRGILPADEASQIRPQAALTRGDFARMLARVVHLLPPRDPTTAPTDVDDDGHSSFAEEVAQVVHAGLLQLDDQRAFRPASNVTRLEAAVALDRLSRRLGTEPPCDETPRIVDLGDATPEELAAVQAAVRTGRFGATEGRFSPQSPWTREAAATAVYELAAFPW